jgi:hypothetical protein
MHGIFRGRDRLPIDVGDRRIDLEDAGNPLGSAARPNTMPDVESPDSELSCEALVLERS